MFSNLKKILNDIDTQINHDVLTATDDDHLFCTAIRSLAYYERLTLEEKMYQIEWKSNIGSAKVYRTLQELGIIQMSNYILRQDDENIQNILNDLLEVEHELLANLINVYCSMSNDTSILKIRAHLDECFKSVVADLIENPNAIKVNYLQILKLHLPEPHLKTIKTFHTKLFLNSTKSTIFQAMKNQKDWQQSFDVASSSAALIELMKESVNINEEAAFALDELLSLVLKTQNFDSWKCYLTYISIFAAENDHSTFLTLKSFLKDTFNNSVNKKNKEAFLVMVLTARQLCNCVASKFGDYQKWYKQTIGEMIYNKNHKWTADTFKFVMDTLTEMIQYESEEILNIHINTAIAAPPHCNDLIFFFKQCSRSQLLRSTHQVRSKPAQTISHNLDEVQMFEDDEEDFDIIIID